MPSNDDPPINPERALIDAAISRVFGDEDSGGASPSATQESVLQYPLPSSFEGYEILREIQRGGQGIVYEGLQKSTRRRVAIKVLKEGPFAGARDRLRFEREVQILGRLHHPSVVTILHSGQAFGSFYFVMDYISGDALDDYVRNAEPSINAALKLFVKICEAVNSAHVHGIMHRDLKPSNIRIDSHGVPHILDFGLAKAATNESDGGHITITGQFMGSLPWASPEQASGSADRIDPLEGLQDAPGMSHHMGGRKPYVRVFDPIIAPFIPFFFPSHKSPISATTPKTLLIGHSVTKKEASVVSAVATKQPALLPTSPTMYLSVAASPGVSPDSLTLRVTTMVGTALTDCDRTLSSSSESTEVTA